MSHPKLEYAFSPVFDNCLAVVDWRRLGMTLGRPTFVPVQDLEMGFEKIVKIAHARGGIKLFSKSHIYLTHFKQLLN